MPVKTLSEGLSREFGIKNPSEIQPSSQGTEAVLMFSDFHYGAKFEGNELFPGYDSDKAIDCFWSMIEWTIEKCRANQIRHLHFVALGDIVDGTHLRIQHARETDRNFADQAIDAANTISMGLKRIMETGTRVSFYGVPGNHARLQAKVGSGDPAENMDIVIYEFVRASTPGLYKTSITKHWYLVEEIVGHGFLLLHGDTVRGYSNPARKVAETANAYSRASRLAERRQGADAIDIEYCLCGHFHAAKMHSDMDVEIYINGSFPSSSEYVATQLAKAERPRQTMLLVEKEHGVSTAMYKFL